MSFGYQISRGGNGPAGVTSRSIAIPGANLIVSLLQPSNIIIIANYSAGTAIFISFLGAATTSSFEIAAGASFVYDGPAVTSFQVIGAANPSGNFGVFAY